jgi:hypothetical protein
VSVNLGQYTVPSSAATLVFNVPPGAASVTFYSTAATVYLGMSTSVTASNGYVVTTVPTAFRSFSGSKAQPVWAWNSAAAGVVLNFIVSTES